MTIFDDFGRLRTTFDDRAAGAPPRPEKILVCFQQVADVAATKRRVIGNRFGSKGWTAYRRPMTTFDDQFDVGCDPFPINDLADQSGLAVVRNLP
jgi:hypothetical protein